MNDITISNLTSLQIKDLKKIWNLVGFEESYSDSDEEVQRMIAHNPNSATMNTTVKFLSFMMMGIFLVSLSFLRSSMSSLSGNTGVTPA